MPSLKPHGQMSEAFITALFLSVSGGLQDVYTYLYRGKKPTTKSSRISNSTTS